MARVLVIDDEELMRDLLRLVLEAEDHSVDEADTGEGGLERLEQMPADLVITDMALPGKDGLEVIREIREAYPETQVVAVSGGGDLAEDKLFPRARAMGVEYTFTKPFLMQDFLQSVAELLGTSSQVWPD